MSVTVKDLLDAVHAAFPFEWAEPWDRVGLLVGDPGAPVATVLVSLDPTAEALARATDAGATVLVTHHPAYLTPPERLVPSQAGVAFDAMSRGVALIAAHTNLDRAPEAADALPRMLGLDPGEPLEDALLNTAVVTVYAPQTAVNALTEAMAAAGAGRIGQYTGCSFEAAGVGSFTPARDAQPHVGAPGERTHAEESRIEMVAPMSTVQAIVAAARAAHPYEEPLITVSEATIARGAARMGRVSHLSEPVTLTAFAEHAAEVFGVSPRVWGPADGRIAAVATATGSAGSLVASAARAGVDVLLAGEVRYHDAQAAVAAGVCVIEVGHDASEWPLVPVLARAVAATPGLSPETVIVDDRRIGWWTPRRSE